MKSYIIDSRTAPGGFGVMAPCDIDCPGVYRTRDGSLARVYYFDYHTERWIGDVCGIFADWDSRGRFNYSGNRDAWDLVYYCEDSEGYDPAYLGA